MFAQGGMLREAKLENVMRSCMQKIKVEESSNVRNLNECKMP